MGWLGVFIFAMGWLTGGLTCVMLYAAHIQIKLTLEKAEEERQNKIRALNPTKYGDMK